jgi:hypothetical protein
MFTWCPYISGLMYELCSYHFGIYFITGKSYFKEVLLHMNQLAYEFRKTFVLWAKAPEHLKI